ncbi:MAG TPA: hypothetical protein VK254_00615 [Candidatus Bathyarchaeia archaeon]|nr:hypothetical protein [Candidatus Bathyarchaeia archaeon]
MKKELVFFVFLAVFGLGAVVSAQADVWSEAAIAVANAEKIASKAQCDAESIRSRPLRDQPTAQKAPATLPVSPPQAPVAARMNLPASLPSAKAPPAIKPPVLVNPAEKPKAPERVAQPSAKVQQPAAAAPSYVQKEGLKVYAMPIPVNRELEIKGVKYQPGEKIWAVVREDAQGKLYDKNGRITNEPDIEKTIPAGATLVSLKLPAK